MATPLPLPPPPPAQPPPDENSTRSLKVYIVFEELGKEASYRQDIMQIN